MCIRLFGTGCDSKCRPLSHAHDPIRISSPLQIQAIVRHFRAGHPQTLRAANPRTLRAVEPAV